MSAVLCMAFLCVSFNYVYLYLAEVYPTSLRNRVTAGKSYYRDDILTSLNDSPLNEVRLLAKNMCMGLI